MYSVEPDLTDFSAQNSSFALVSRLQLLGNLCLAFILYDGKSVRSWCDGSSDRSFMMDPLNYFQFQPMLHDWCKKGHAMCYPVCVMVHIKELLLLIEFPLFEWSFTICQTPYNWGARCSFVVRAFAHGAMGRRIGPSW